MCPIGHLVRVGRQRGSQQMIYTLISVHRTCREIRCARPQEYQEKRARSISSWCAQKEFAQFMSGNKKKYTNKKCQSNGKGIKQHGQGYCQLIGSRMCASLYRSPPLSRTLSLSLSRKYLRHFRAIILARKVRKLCGARNTIDLSQLPTEQRKLTQNSFFAVNGTFSSEC